MSSGAADAAIARFVREDASLLFLALDGRGVVVEANRHALEFAGQDIPGKPFSSLLVDFTRPLDPLQLAREGARGVLASLSPREGLPRSYTLSFVRDGEGVLVFGELPAEELDRLRETLIHMNGELSNLARQAQKSNAELKKLHEVKNQFLGIAAHDLRNPIGAIKSFSDFLLEEGSGWPTDLKDILETINDSSAYMLHLLDDLLDVARIESGRLGLELRETDLVSLVKRCVSLNRPMAQKKGVPLTLIQHESPPALMLDPPKIMQVVNNLLSNAIKFSSQGQAVCVDIFLSGDYAAVAVRDHGKGIARQDLDRIFDPFNKISYKGTAGERCSGLGLSIARRIVQGHEGRVWVESVEGQGATFFFTLPLKRKA